MKDSVKINDPFLFSLSLYLHPPPPPSHTNFYYSMLQQLSFGLRFPTGLFLISQAVLAFKERSRLLKHQQGEQLTKQPLD